MLNLLSFLFLFFLLFSMLHNLSKMFNYAESIIHVVH